MSESLYFIWRLSADEIYRVYGTRNHNLPDDDDARCIWIGDDVKEAWQIAKMKNDELRTRAKIERTELRKRNSESRQKIKAAKRANDARTKMFAWKRGVPKDGGTIFG